MTYVFAVWVSSTSALSSQQCTSCVDTQTPLQKVDRDSDCGAKGHPCFELDAMWLEHMGLGFEGGRSTSMFFVFNSGAFDVPVVSNVYLDG